MSSLSYMFKNVAKCSSLVMKLHTNQGPAKKKYATVGFARCGNVFINRKFRFDFEDEWMTQTHHSAGMASLVAKRGTKTLVIVRNPVDCVLSNKVANTELSIFAIYFSYILFLLRVRAIKNITIIDFEDVVGDTEKFKSIADTFLVTRDHTTLPTSEVVKQSILNDRPQDGNRLFLSAPTQEKREKKALYQSEVESHYLCYCACFVYRKLLQKSSLI